jgi:three-Cys-motif partner protein
LNSALQHRADLSDCELVFVFVEEDPARFENLQSLVNDITIPANVHVQLGRGAFADLIGGALDRLDEAGQTMAPALVMVDPFGWKGMPMSLLSRIAQHPRSELLISFMYESINRWLGQPDLEASFDELFGVTTWRDAFRLGTRRQRLDFLHELYVQQLRAAGMTYSRSFLMLDSGNRPEYFLIFATHHIEGLKAMKRAMWHVAPSGSYQFSDATDPNQLTLLESAPDFGQLKQLVLSHFQRGVPVRVEDIELYVVTDTLGS